MDSLYVANESKGDRIARTALGIVLLAFVVLGPKTAWGFVGLVPLVTGVLGTCPIYRLFGITTCPVGP